MLKPRKKALTTFSLLGLAFTFKGLAEPMPQELSPVAEARSYFRHHDYEKALSLVSDDEASILIAAESAFRLGQYEKAKGYFEKLLANNFGPKRKIDIRLFEIALALGDVARAEAIYESFPKQNRPAKMSYGLGKAFFDGKEYEKARAVLSAIDKDSEFYLRARYILASLDVGVKKPQELVKLFKQIEDEKMVSVEDHGVHDLAILAQGRILVDAKREDLADAVYQRITSGPYFAKATEELVTALLNRANRAKYSLGSFKNASEFARSEEIKKDNAQALLALERYQKTSPIDWQTPNLLALQAELLGKNKRYDEAQVAYGKLFDHYNLVKEQLKDTKLWDMFDVDKKTAELALIPKEFLPKSEEILQLKDQLQKAQEDLLELREAKMDEALLAEAQTLHDDLKDQYLEIASIKQKEMSEQILASINKQLAEPEFKRAELVLAQMNDMKKQLDAVQDYQTNKIDNFERQRAIGKGGAK